jgi:diguanylate cyclase (GGDEF)-like protein
MTDEMGPGGGDPQTLIAALDRIHELEAQLDKALFDVGNLRLQMDMFSVTDTLTGLRNVNGVITALERAAVRSRRSKEPFALMAVDIPALEEIATSYGQRAHDDAVRHCGALISACLRRLDTVGRMDEAGFHLVLPMLDTAGVDPVIARIEDLLARMPMEFNGAEVELTPVFTIMLNNPDGTNDIQRMVKELAIARERPTEESPIVIRAKAVVEEPFERD